MKSYSSSSEGYTIGSSVLVVAITFSFVFLFVARAIIEVSILHSFAALFVNSLIACIGLALFGLVGFCLGLLHWRLMHTVLWVFGILVVCMNVSTSFMPSVYNDPLAASVMKQNDEIMKNAYKQGREYDKELERRYQENMLKWAK